MVLPPTKGRNTDPRFSLLLNRSSYRCVRTLSSTVTFAYPYGLASADRFWTPCDHMWKSRVTPFGRCYEPNMPNLKGVSQIYWKDVLSYPYRSPRTLSGASPCRFWSYLETLFSGVTALTPRVCDHLLR